MTGANRTTELYDEMERLARSLVECFDIDRGLDKYNGTGAKSRMLDPEILFGRVAALNDTAQEWKYLKKFRGTLQLVKEIDD